ncbi:GerAB/ArcD/ProY family transporter [Sporosarcina sp. FSL W8-0480]|uniref:GerAB/ArcD/ProY family transporter n=1 Tax=Sporosarcina sp. FSL W8-0480 TaxID=2954701 RepID=UPI0030DB0080
MSRFLFYLILINLLTNMVSTTPRTFILDNTQGVLNSLFLAIAVGMIFTYFLISLFSHFPGMTLPEILNSCMPKWISTPIILFLSISWYGAGLITLITYVFIIIRFLTPEMSIYLIVLSFAAIITYGVFMQTKSILFTSEILVVLVVPLILFVQLKGYLDKDFDWDYVRIAIMHINHLPSYRSFTTALYVTIGIANLIVFNRYFTDLRKPSRKAMALLTLICFFIIMTTYLLPIGLSGFEALENVPYPWIMTSDSMRMKFGLIERVVFIFIGAFLAISVLSIIIHWHVSMHLFESIFNFNRLKWKSFKLKLPIYALVFWVIAMIATKMFTGETLFKSAYYFDMYLLPAILVILIGCLLYAKRRAKSCPEVKK